MAIIDTQSMGKQLNELMVLASLQSGARHGYQIALEAEARSSGALTLQHGTLYPILHRLERAGEIRGKWQRVGGRRRKVYELTPAGSARLRRDRGELQQSFERVLRMLTEPGSESIRARPATS